MNTPNQSEALLEQAKKALEMAYHVLSSVKMENSYQEKTFQAVLDAYHAINKATKG